MSRVAKTKAEPGVLSSAERDLLHRLPSACPPRLPEAARLVELGLARKHGTLHVAAAVRGKSAVYDFVVITTRGFAVKESGAWQL